MRLPRPQDATVSERKILEYLLSPTHPDGWGKARFYQQHGYDPDNWEVLAADLKKHAADNDVSRVESDLHRAKYVVEGPILTPSGRIANLRVVWAIPSGEDTPRLVTAYPIRPRLKKV